MFVQRFVNLSEPIDNYIFIVKLFARQTSSIQLTANPKNPTHPLQNVILPFMKKYNCRTPILKIKSYLMSRAVL
jgi:hypothetical protein